MGTCRPASLRIAPLVLILLPVAVLASSHVSGTSLAGSPRTTPPGTSPAATSGAGPSPILTFEERVAAQEAIERVYFAHQIGATRPFQEAVPRAVLEEKVQTYLKKSVALEKMWNTQITGEMLRSEVERMVRETRMPDRLRETFAALHGDSVIVEECLARPILVNRLARERFAFDRSLHESARREAENLRRQLKSGRLGVTEAEGHRTVIEFVRKQTEAAKSESTLEGPAATSDAAGEASAVSPVETVESSPEEFASQRGMAPARVGDVGEIVEESDAFVIRTVLEEGADRFREATYRFPKVSWDAWWIGEKDRFDENGVEAVSAGASPLPNPVGDSVSPSTSCQPDNTWMPGILQAQPYPISLRPAVWTGSLMISWAGPQGYDLRYDVRYDPTTDTATPITTINAPQDRSGHTAVWTGTRMIIWGGVTTSHFPYLNTGGLYDPIADSWQPTPTAGAPVGRIGHTAIWTGSRMFVYGGQLCLGPPGNPCTGFLSANDGGSYNPQADAWAPLPPAGTLCGGRYNHAATWTGSEMAIWGGVCESASCDCAAPSNEGARYNPGTNLWTPMSTVNAPAGRDFPGAVWTGSRMLIWGGGNGAGPAVPGGGSYDPAGDSWSPISTVNAPPTATQSSVVWTGSTMIAWGGQSSGTNPDYYNEGGRYDPASDTWSPTSTVGAPTPRSGHPAVWTGSLMVIAGGIAGYSYADSAGTTHGRYDPVSDTWMPEPELVIGRAFHAAVWTGSEMIVWGGTSGNGGDRYDPATDSWSSISLVNAPSIRDYQTAVWTGTEMIVWGGKSPIQAPLDSGGRYDPATDSWTPTSLIGAPSPRYRHTAVWTGTEMIIWGGSDGWTSFDSGGRFNPATDTWAPTQLTGAPQPRYSHTAVWTGSRMIVWGGAGNSGGLYDPVADAWTPTSTTNAPSARSSHGAVWTGSQMVVWGGSGGGTTGGRYDPVGNTWTSTSQVNAPQARRDFTAVWADFVMVVWGGLVKKPFYPLDLPTNTGGRYNPVSDTWTSTPLGAPGERYAHTAVWTGDQVIVWGGDPFVGPYLNDGGALNVNTTNVDGDGDTYVACAGDCNDADPTVHPGAIESCNAIDDDCNGTVDAFSTACGLGPCHSTGSCVMGVDDCTPGPSSPEACNGIDDDCNGLVPSNEIDGDGDGVRVCQSDCNDSNALLWATPGEVEAVTFTGPTTMSWQSPVSPGATSIVYDVIRSSSKSSFTTGASCPYTNGTSTSFLPNAVPPLGQAYYFLVRAEDACPQGMGSVGNASNGTPRTARTCP